MTSRTRPSFWRAYARLIDANRQAVRRAYALFAEYPDHSSLRFKKLGGYEHVWSVRITEHGTLMTATGAAQKRNRYRTRRNHPPHGGDGCDNKPIWRLANPLTAGQ